MSILSNLFSKQNGKDWAFKKSYSQDGEDMILRSLFDDLGGKKNGFYIDIGALHPFRFSNTAYFYHLGWKGINIEPSPGAIELFKKYRKRDINLNIGIGDKEGELTFYCFDEPALNSFSKEVSEDRDRNTSYYIIGTEKIAIQPLAVVLDKYLPAGTHIDFLSVDVEGLDVQVLKSNNWDKYKPAFIIAEDIIEFDNLSKSEVYNFLIEKGYQLKAMTERSMIFQLK